MQTHRRAHTQMHRNTVQTTNTKITNTTNRSSQNTAEQLASPVATCQAIFSLTEGASFIHEKPLI